MNELTEAEREELLSAAGIYHPAEASALFPAVERIIADRLAAQRRDQKVEIVYDEEQVREMLTRLRRPKDGAA